MNYSLDKAKDLLHQKMFQEALAQYREFQEKFPDAPEGYLGIAQCYLGLKYYDQALSYAKMAVGLAPNSPNTHVTQSYIYLAQNQVSKSREEADLALELDAESSEVLECLGTVLLYQKDFKAAIPILEKAVAKNPGSLIAHINLAHIYDRTGQTTSLVQHLEAALRARPSIKNGYYLLSAYMRKHFILTNLIVLLITSIAYYTNIKFLLIIPALFLVQIVWRLCMYAYRRN